MIQVEQQTSPPLTLGCSTQLLLDDYVVDDVWNIRRSPELPMKYLGNPIIDSHPVVGDCSVVAQSVMYDEEERLFKLWYTLVDTNMDTFPPGYHQDSVHSYLYRGAYAVSQDGLHWECPDLGIIEYRGSAANNLFQSEGCGFVLKDGHESDPSRRYKMLTKRSSKGGRVFAAFSPDGVHWTDHSGGAPVVPNSRDGGNSFVYDPRLGKIPGFTCRECHGVSGNGFDLPISWSRKSDVQELMGNTVRLRFYLREARLYSFQLDPPWQSGYDGAS